MRRTRMVRPIEYRDRKDRVWYASEVARLKVVSPSIDGPNVAVVIRFEREGEERFARWIGDDWLQRDALDRLFAEAEPGDQTERSAPETSVPVVREKRDDIGVGAAPPETVALWVKLVATMGPDELADFEERTFRQWDRASLFDVRRAIERRRQELGRTA